MISLRGESLIVVAKKAKSQSGSSGSRPQSVAKRTSIELFKIHFRGEHHSVARVMHRAGLAKDDLGNTVRRVLVDTLSSEPPDGNVGSSVHQCFVECVL